MKRQFVVIAIAIWPLSWLWTSFFSDRSVVESYPVIKTQWLSHLDEVFDACDKRTMVLFDIDDTLLSSHEVWARSVGREPLWFKLRALLAYPSLIKEQRREWLYSKLFELAPRELIEPSIVRRIAALRVRNVWVFGMTSMESGSYGCIPSMPHWRYAMLNRLGVRFTVRCHTATLQSLPIYRGTKPLFYNGILCCNQQPKGAVLAALLSERVEVVRPKKIVAVDDDYAALQSIGATCAKLEIPCVLVHYTGGHRMRGSFSTKRALLQLTALMNHSRYLTDNVVDHQLYLASL